MIPKHFNNLTFVLMGDKKDLHLVEIHTKRIWPEEREEIWDKDTMSSKPVGDKPEYGNVFPLVFAYTDPNELEEDQADPELEQGHPMRYYVSPTLEIFDRPLPVHECESDYIRPVGRIITDGELIVLGKALMIRGEDNALATLEPEKETQ